MRNWMGTVVVVLVMTALAVVADERAEIVIPADRLATAEQRADQPVASKWWLRRDAQDWGAPNGLVLMTGRPSDKPNKMGEWVVTSTERFVPYRVPALEIDPKASGWYRMHVGLYHAAIDPIVRPMLLAKLSGEPFGEYLQTPQQTKEHTVEVSWKVANLTGKKIQIEQPPAPMPHPGYGWLGGITHVRLVPMTDVEVAAARDEIELPPPERRLFGMLDYTDEVFWWGTVEREDDIRAVVYRHQQAGFGRIYWRAYGSHLDNSLDVPDAAPRWTDADEARWCQAQNCQSGWMPYINLTRKFDPLKVAVEYGQQIGCEVHAWVRFTNHNREPYAKFWHEHPEFRAQRLATELDPKTGQRVPVKPYKLTEYARVLSIAYPEVRAYYIQFFKQLASTGTRGIMIDLLRHPPIAGYEPIVADAFKKKYGMEMESRDLFHDPLVNEHLSKYLRQFLVELRQAVGKDIEISVRSSGPEKYALRGKEWIAEGLIDTIVDGNWYSGNGPRPTIEATVEAAAARSDKLPSLSSVGAGKAFAVAESSDVDPNKSWQRREGTLSPEAITALSKQYSGRGVARFGLYESTLFTWQPDHRRAVRAAGWNFVSSIGKK
jgi:hypothetical protein